MADYVRFSKLLTEHKNLAVVAAVVAAAVVAASLQTEVCIDSVPE